MLFLASQPVTCLSFHTTIFPAHHIFLMASGIDWAQACNTATNRPVPEMRTASIAANGVAVSHFTLPGRCAASRRLLTPSTDFGLRYCCRFLRYFLFAGLQTAALEAQRQRGGRGPGLEESAAVQRLYVCKLRGGHRFVSLCPAVRNLFLRFT